MEKRALNATKIRQILALGKDPLAKQLIHGSKHPALDSISDLTVANKLAKGRFGQTARKMSGNLHDISYYPFTRSIQNQYGLVDRATVLKGIKDKKLPINPNQLKDRYYIQGEHPALFTPFSTINNINADRAMLGDVAVGIKWKTLHRNAMNQASPERRKLWASLVGKNVLENPQWAQMKDPVISTIGNKVMSNIHGGGFYNAAMNAIFINPKNPRAAQILNHERGHMAAANMPIQEHAREAKSLFRKLQHAARTHNLNIPFTDSRLMQDAFADGYKARHFGPSGNRYAVSRLVAPKADTIKGSPSRVARARQLSILRDRERRINALGVSPEVSEMLKQLSINYGYDIFAPRLVAKTLTP